MESSSTAIDKSPRSEPRFPVPGNRSICDVKIEEHLGPGGQGKAVWLEWTDAVNERHCQQFYGATADQIAIDLHASTLMGEWPRHTYLIGLVRGLYIERRVG